jgi:hypothetical protein
MFLRPCGSRMPNRLRQPRAVAACRSERARGLAARACPSAFACPRACAAARATAWPRATGRADVRLNPSPIWGGWGNFRGCYILSRQCPSASTTKKWTDAYFRRPSPLSKRAQAARPVAREVWRLLGHGLSDSDMHKEGGRRRAPEAWTCTSARRFTSALPTHHS